MLSEFLIKIGTSANLGGLNQAVAGLGSLTKKAAVAGAALSTALGGLTAFTKKSLEELDSLAQLSRETGVAADTIQTLGRVAETNGGSMQAAMATVKDLSKTIGQAANGFSAGAKAFEDWGLSAKKANGQVKTVGEMIEEIQAKMQNLSFSQQQALLEDLHISAEMLQTLRLSRQEWAEAREEANALSLSTASLDGVNTAADFMDALTKIEQMLRAVWEVVALSLAPVFSQFVGKVRDWFKANKEMIKGELKNFAEKIKTIGEFLGIFLDVIDNIISSTISWKWALTGLVAVFLALKIAAAPFLLVWTVIGAAIAGVILLIDDFITAFNGEDSYFGDAWVPLIVALKTVFKWFNTIKTAFLNSDFFAKFASGGKSALEKLLKYLGNVWGLIKGFFHLFLGLMTANGDLISSGFSEIVENIKNVFINGFDFIKTTLETFADLMVEVLSGVGDLISLPFKSAFEKVATMARNILPSGVADFLGLGGEKTTGAEIQAMAKSAVNLSQSAKAGVLNKTESNKILNNNTKIDVSVNTTGDPSTVGRAVGDGVAMSIANTQSKQSL